jgi:hypothetical protein
MAPAKLLLQCAVTVNKSDPPHAVVTTNGAVLPLEMYVRVGSVQRATPVAASPYA